MATHPSESTRRDAPVAVEHFEQLYEHEETRSLVALVNEAAALIAEKGDAAFDELRRAGSPWRQDETYIFVLDPDGNMLVHPDRTMEGRNQLGLEDIAGKPIIRGLIAAVMLPGKPEGWYHYQWPVPGGLLPRWKSSYVRLVTAPSGRRYVVGSGVYNDRMERAFVVDMVTDAAARIEKEGEAAHPLLYDPKGPYLAKDAYVFVFSSEGVELVNPAFPTLVGRNLREMKDTLGKRLIVDMIDLARTSGSGWVDYMWPRPGESVSTEKSAYVRKATIGEQWVVVGCGVYLVDAPRAVPTRKQMTAPELMAFVREAATVFEQRGEAAYPEFRQKGSRWFRDGTYFFACTMDGIRCFSAADPDKEGDRIDVDDALGRPIAGMIAEAANSPSGEGWIHYMYPEPGNVFPAWKSTFVKRVTFPSGKQVALGCGIYNMQMDKALIEDVVDRAAALITTRGRDAFGALRDRRGPFVFMDTYVFVLNLDGVELVNAAQPGLENKNLMDLRDLTGRAVARDEIAAALEHGSAWMDVFWYRPGTNTPARKHTYVRKVDAGSETFIVGSGIYLE